MNRKNHSSKRIRTDGEVQEAFPNPFSGLEMTGLPEASFSDKANEEISEEVKPALIKKGRLDLRREVAGRRGKGVVTIAPAERVISMKELKDIARYLQQRLASGGTVKGNVIEIQGDRLPEVRRLLEEKGYRCKQIGG